jgi:hypothetical protein
MSEDTAASGNDLFLRLEEKWVGDAVEWIDYLRCEGRVLLELPIPTPFLVSRSHFFDFVEYGELHIQRFPIQVVPFLIEELSPVQILALYNVVKNIFSDENFYDQMYLVRECRARVEGFESKK